MVVYNDILSNVKTRGTNEYPPWWVRGFGEEIMNCNIQDISLHGHQLTWVMRRGNLQVKDVKFGRALATIDWPDNFPTH